MWCRGRADADQGSKPDLSSAQSSSSDAVGRWDRKPDHPTNPTNRINPTDLFPRNPELTCATPGGNLPPVGSEVIVPKTRVLIVEDEQDIAGLIKHTLERGGEIDAQTVDSGDAALKAVTDHPPDLIILDLNLPVIGGLEVCRVLRSRPATARLPIIMLTAKTSESDRVNGLDVGADDYVTKPFSLRELAARVRAVLRRGKADAPGATIYRGKYLVADFEAVSVSVEGTAVRLTRREFELLKYLVENRNRVLSRDRLLERVWGYDRLIETRSVDVHVGRLRGKLGPVGQQIETVVGLGYRFVE
jgi:two-component system, OmpR family, alkaline phosphatase synthesis response regulator PhoP